MTRPIAWLGAVMIVTAACSGPAGAQVTPPPGALVIASQGSVFQPASLAATVGQAFPLFFDNRDTVPHNVRIVDGGGQSLAFTEVFSGPAARVADVPALAAGTFRMLCDVHPEMLAELVAAP